MKDYFNGNIKKPTDLFIELCIIAVIMFCCSIFLLWIALFYDNCEFSARVLLIILSVLAFVFSIGYPIITIHVVKNRKKYPRLAKYFVKPNRFSD